MAAISSIIASVAAAGASIYSAKKQSDAAKRAAKNMPIPGAPIPIPELEDSDDAMRRQKKRKGRSSTILTGDLIPADSGKATLLGGSSTMGGLSLAPGATMPSGKGYLIR